MATNSSARPSMPSRNAAMELEDPFAPFIGRTEVCFGKTTPTANEDVYNFGPNAKLSLDMKISKRDIVIMFWFVENSKDIAKAMGADLPAVVPGFPGMMKLRSKFVEENSELVDRPLMNIINGIMPIKLLDGLKLAKAIRNVRDDISPEDWFKLLHYCAEAGKIASNRTFRSILRRGDQQSAHTRLVLRQWLSWCEHVERLGAGFGRIWSAVKADAGTAVVRDGFWEYEVYDFTTNNISRVWFEGKL